MVLELKKSTTDGDLQAVPQPSAPFSFRMQAENLLLQCRKNENTIHAIM
jgi:hypothetical protein